MKLEQDESTQSDLSEEVQAAIRQTLSLLTANGVPFRLASYLHDSFFPTLTISHEDAADPAGGYLTEEVLGNRPYLLISLDIDEPTAVGFVRNIAEHLN